MLVHITSCRPASCTISNSTKKKTVMKLLSEHECKQTQIEDKTPTYLIVRSKLFKIITLGWNQWHFVFLIIFFKLHITLKNIVLACNMIYWQTYRLTGKCVRKALLCLNITHRSESIEQKHLSKNAQQPVNNLRGTSDCIQNWL